MQPIYDKLFVELRFPLHSLLKKWLLMNNVYFQALMFKLDETVPLYCRLLRRNGSYTPINICKTLDTAARDTPGCMSG